MDSIKSLVVGRHARRAAHGQKTRQECASKSLPRDEFVQLPR
jgi:hypothetical protein